MFEAAGWELMPHEADIGVRGWGATPAVAFEQAALALTAVVTDPTALKGEEEVRVEVAAPDLELLLVDWLNGLIFQMATRHLLFGRYEVQIEGERLVGRAWGEAADPGRHDLSVEVKAATYTALAVRRLPDRRWLAQCVVDV